MSMNLHRFFQIYLRRQHLFQFCQAMIWPQDGETIKKINNNISNNFGDTILVNLILQDAPIQNDVISIDLDTIPIDEIPTKINDEILSQPVDDLVILLAPETPAEEVKYVIEEFLPKSENLTVLVGEKIIDEKRPVEDITDKMIQALPIIPGVLQKVIDEEPDSIIPVIKNI